MLPSPRIRSPKGSTSPRAHLSNTDLLCAGFLRNFKFILLVTVCIALARLVVLPTAGPIIQEYSQYTQYSSPSSLSSSSTSEDAPTIRVPSGSGRVETKPTKKETDRSQKDPSVVDTPKSKSPDDTHPKDSSKSSSNSNNDDNHSKDPSPTDSKSSDFNNDDYNHSEDSSPKTDKSPTEQSSNSNNSENHPKDPSPTTNASSISNRTDSNQQKQTKEVLLSYYNASFSPVIPGGVRKMVQVHLVVDITSESGIVEPSSKFLLSAIERSKYLKAVGVTFVRQLPPLYTQEMHPRDPASPLLFLVDWGSLNRDCHRLQLVLEKIREEYSLETNDNNNKSNSTNKSLSSQLKEAYTLLVDFTGSTRQTKCEYLFQDSYIQDKSRVRLAKRSIVQGRYYNYDTNEMYLGQIVSPLEWHPNGEASPILYSPLILRETFVNAILNVTQGIKVENMNRSIDVGAFWTNGDYSHYSSYRRDITKVVKTLHHSKINSQVLMENEVGLAYTDIKGYVLGNIQAKYVEKILSCKIVVVTQRDEWEDQYRLMESLASGALVMTDDMLAMPDGLIDKVNVIVYDSPTSLKTLIRYYLHPDNEAERKRIALEGYKLVMGRHRCWHRLEELVFGEPLTNAYQPYKPAPIKEQGSTSVYWMDTDGDWYGQFL
ncbi:glycosyl transferase group 1 protein [Nitzschia inconspicua]|uniref:Glycosyl transferase group 1 protein n=1 Tax=Nitzschia inconspicua TaxID=303405 RepID=A0A9K3L881_9STRA|nr:glycosyl transferase group 1 protein [Nitzschia inconspicua]